MRTFADTQHSPRNPATLFDARSKTAATVTSHHTNPALHWQITVGNQAVQRIRQSHGEDFEAGLSATASPRFGHDFGRIPLHSPAARSTITRPATNQPWDGYAQAPDALADDIEEARLNPVAAGGAMVKLPMRGIIHPVAASLARPGVRFRLPEFARVKAAYTDKDLNIPESVIKDRVGQLLGRMEHEGRLKSTDDVPTILSKMFPAPGKIDEAAFNDALDVKDREIIYKSVFDASTNVKAADKPKLKALMKDAADIITKAEGNATGLTEVFGSEDTNAKANYAKARVALGDASKNMASSVSTDYNLDDPEVGLGGWADFSGKHMHLLADVVKGTDPDKSKATLIHEAAHLADSSVDDHVYYGNDGFFELDEATKVGNAAHYEELPRREMGTSKFAGLTFTPGVNVGGGAVTREDKIKAEATNYLRQAWDAAVDTHMLIRGVRQAKLSGNDKPFTDNEALIIEISKLMDLTIHEQAAGKQIVTMLDVTLSESIARGVKLVRGIAKTLPFPSPIGALTDLELRDQIVATSVTQYGNLLKDATRDKALLDWFVAHYRSLPSP